MLSEIVSTLGQLENRTTRIESEGDKLARQILTMQELTRIMYRLMAILRRLGLPPEMERAIGQISRLIMITRMLLMAFKMIELSSPYGWIMGILGIAVAGLSVGDEMMEAQGTP
jgi:hypothetical protein